MYGSIPVTSMRALSFTLGVYFVLYLIDLTDERILTIDWQSKVLKSSAAHEITYCDVIP